MSMNTNSTHININKSFLRKISYISFKCGVFFYSSHYIGCLSTSDLYVRLYVGKTYQIKRETYLIWCIISVLFCKLSCETLNYELKKAAEIVVVICNIWHFLYKITIYKYAIFVVRNGRQLDIEPWSCR